MDAWHDFALAAAGASAALTGLVFVALSINLSQIMSEHGLVGRAAEALLLLTMPLFIALVALMPDQAHEVTGLLVLAVAAIAGAPMVRALVVDERDVVDADLHRTFVIRSVTVLVVLGAIVVGGILVAAGVDGGGRVVAYGMLLAIAAGIVDAWVLLVEILR